MKVSKNMKLGVDISQIVYAGTGVARFTKGLVSSILNFDETNDWLFFFSSLRRNLDSETQRRIADKGHRLIKWRLPPAFLSFFWNDLHSYSQLIPKPYPLSSALDWFITSDWTEPAASCKKATIVHDLAYLRYPETVTGKILSTQKKRMKWVKKETKIIFSDSQATKNDLVKLLNISAKRIIVNYPGVAVVQPVKKDINSTLKKYNLAKPFVLTIGKLEPRKNLSRLVAAFQKNNFKNLDLVIAGPKGWGNKNPNQTASVKYLGTISDTELFSLYSSCLFFIYPSLWEGFGFPVIEAMKLGAPVAVSNTSSLKEIAENAALLFDPLNVKDIANSIHRLVNDENLRKDLSKRGLDRSKIFTWENYYQKLVNVLSEY